MKRRRFPWGFSLIALPLGLLLCQVAWFNRCFSRPRPALRADMLAVYGGLPIRYEAGWSLERQGRFGTLVFSDASADYVSQMEARHGSPLRARLLMEPRARTTAQNARYVARLALDQGCASVLIVTSWWHLPRALFLTDIAFLGSGVRVAGWAVDAPLGSAWGDPRVWLECLRFWGSLLTYESDVRRAVPWFNGIFTY